MIESHPPRFTESLLESFGADAEFRDAILGDLAQEYAQRVDRYGQSAARLWYHRQALRTAPHLLRQWWSGAAFSDFRRLLNVAGLAYVSTMAVSVALYFVFTAITYFFRPSAGLVSTSMQIAGVYLASVITPTIAGYFAAAYEEKRPMLAALALGAAWTTFIVAGAVLSVFIIDPAKFSPLVPPTWARLVLIPIVLASSMVGGAVRVWRVNRPLQPA